MVMKRAYYRVGFTAGQSEELWERWKRGEGLKAIGRVLGKPSSCIFSHLSVSGGIRPPFRRRSRLALTLAEREDISRGLVAGRSVRSMALALRRALSTVSRAILAIAHRVGTAPQPPTSAPGNRRCARSRVSWRCVTSCGKLLRQSWNGIGRPSRSRVG